MFKIIGLVLMLLALAGVLATLEGMRLPVPHVVTRTVVLPALPDSVFATITDFANAPSWRPDLDRVDLVPNEGGRFRFSEVSGRDVLSMEVEASDPPRRLVTRIVGQGLPFGGAWAYAVAPEHDGSRLTITEHGEVYNPFFRFVSRYILGHTMTLDRYLKALGTKYGVAVTPEDGPLVPLR